MNNCIPRKIVIGCSTVGCTGEEKKRAEKVDTKVGNENMFIFDIAENGRQRRKGKTNNIYIY